MYDAVIIGAGVTGSAIARYLSRYDLSICVIEKSEDVCTGTSKANSAIVHAGYDAAHGSLMAKYNVRGSEMMEELSKELDFAYDRCGSLVVCFSEDERPNLVKLYENGLKNGVKDMRIIERDELVSMEPNISDSAVCALWAPTGAIVCPFGLTIALAENAYMNGVEFKFDTEVQSIEKASDGDFYEIRTDRETILSRSVINAAGVYSDVFHNMMCPEKPIHITPRKGEYLLLDHATSGFVTHTIFQLPGKYGKGILVTPTVHGNTLIGPTATDIEEKEGTNTTAAGLADVIEKAGISVKNLPNREVITSFAGLRAHEDGHEFVLGPVDGKPGYFDAAGIESPGLTSAPAIGEALSDMAAAYLGASKKADFIAKRTGILDPKTLSKEERNALIKEKPAYGQIICRCESISEGEIIDAIRRPLGAKSLDGVKRRVRAGMGRCQAGFCSPRVIEILARELNVPKETITKAGGSSKIIVGEVKDGIL